MATKPRIKPPTRAEREKRDRTLKEANKIDDYPVREGKDVRMLRRDKGKWAIARKQDNESMADKAEQLRDLRRDL
jgi:hypothetical protein